MALIVKGDNHLTMFAFLQDNTAFLRYIFSDDFIAELL
jgi:hypothetical protein